MKSNPFIKKIFTVVTASTLLFSCGEREHAHDHDSTAHDTANAQAETSEVTLTDAQFRMAGIRLGAVEMKQISGTFKANGMLDVPPQQMISISVPMGGFLKTTSLLQGKRVKKGERIAVIENPEYIQMQQDYLEAKSQLEYAKADYERQTELSKENINARKTLQQAKANFETLSAKVSALKEKIKVSGINLAAVEKGDIQSSINLYAPINGFVTQVNVNIGKFVNPTDILFEIVDTEHLHAELTVFEKDVPKLEIGQNVRFTLANETIERTATVYLIGREIGEDRTVRVHCHIDKEDIHLLPGMYLKAIVETGSQAKGPALPDAAIVNSEDRKYIFISVPKGADDAEADGEHHFRMIAVQTGNNDAGYTEVMLPRDIGNTGIVVSGAYSLLSAIKNSGEGHGH